MTRRRWGAAGVPLTSAEAAEIDRRAGHRKYERDLEHSRAYRAWAAGKVVPHRITVALDAHGLEGPEVDEACGAAEPDVDRWEVGTQYPTWDQLCALARLTGVRPRFFMIRTEPIEMHMTTLRFHRVGGHRDATREAPPVLRFTDEAIAATVPRRRHQ